MANDWQLKAVLSANAESMLRTLKFVNQATKTTRKYLMDVGSSATNLAGRAGLPLGLISGALGALSVAGIKAAATSFAELGDQVVKSAQRIGVTTGEYQRLKYAAGQSGVSVEGLGLSMGRLNKGVALAAAGGNKELAKVFNRAGIAMRDAKGHLRSAADLLPEVAQMFVKNKGAAVQARIGTTIFGKGWQELAPLLQGGAEGIDLLNKRYEELGLAVGEKALKSGEEFGDKLEDLDMVVKSYGNTIAAELVPEFNKSLESTIKWAVANRALIVVPVAKFIANMADQLKSVDWTNVVKGVGNFVVGIKDFIGWIGGAKNALIGLAVIMNAQTIVALIGLVASLGRAAFAFLAMGVQAYIAGNASLLSMVRVAAVALFTAGPLGVLGAAFAWMGSIASASGGLLSGAMGLATMAVRGLGAALMANPLGIIIGIATAAYLIYKNWDTLKGWFSSFFDWVGEKFQKFLGWAKSLAGIVGVIFGGDGSGDGASGNGAGGSSRGGRPFSYDGAFAAENGARPNIGDSAMQYFGGARPPLTGNTQQQVGGKFTFDFQNAPPGMRVAGIETKGNTDVDMSVGTRSYALD